MVAHSCAISAFGGWYPFDFCGRNRCSNLYLSLILMSKKQLIIHVFTLVLGFCFFAYWLKIPYLYFLALLILTSLLHLKLAEIIVKVWIGIGEYLGKINGTIILTLLFFFLLWPLSLLKKLVQTKPIKKNTSGWKNAPPITDFRRPF
jgi:hypothetical protein